MQNVKIPPSTGKQKVASPKTSTGGRKMKTGSVDNPDEPTEERKQFENQPESVDEKSEKGDEYDSDSSTSEDEDDMPGLTEEEEKERQREKREKVCRGSIRTILCSISFKVLIIVKSIRGLHDACEWFCSVRV